MADYCPLFTNNFVGFVNLGNFQPRKAEHFGTFWNIRRADDKGKKTHLLDDAFETRDLGDPSAQRVAYRHRWLRGDDRERHFAAVQEDGLSVLVIAA